MVAKTEMTLLWVKLRFIVDMYNHCMYQSCNLIGQSRPADNSQLLIMIKRGIII